MINSTPKNYEKYLKEGDLCLQMAEKSQSKGFFKKPNWEEAAAHYRDAVKAYERTGDIGVDKLVLTLRKCAIAQDESGSVHTSAKNYERIGQITQCQKHIPDACEAYEAASRGFRASGLPDKAAAMLFKAAELLADEGSNAEGAMKLLDDA